MKLWGGRFKQNIHPGIEAFTKSIGFDVRLATADIMVNKAQVKALLKAGLVTKEESGKLLSTLNEIEKELKNGNFTVKNSDEDIHSTIERTLTERLGDIGAKIHAGRSRNDQVNTDFRIFVKDEVNNVLEAIKELQSVILNRSEEHIGTSMPGYTHLQRAQPVLLSHHLMAYFWMLERDKNRLIDCLVRMDVLPLGSAALAGTTLDIDHNILAEELGFGKITDNSLDSVSDRDFAVEFLSCLAIIQMHLSRLAEEIVLWTSSEFSFAVLPDSLATGSSMMPHKKNPDAAELIRGKTGRVYGSLISLLTALKGLPLSYNRDLQEDKEALFDAVDTVKDCLGGAALIIEEIEFDKVKLSAASEDWLLNITDLMEYLVAKGEPLRKAHETAGKLVAHCLEANTEPKKLTQEQLNAFSEKLSKDWIEKLTADFSINIKKSAGSTSTESVKNQIKKAKAILKSGG